MFNLFVYVLGNLKKLPTINLLDLSTACGSPMNEYLVNLDKYSIAGWNHPLVMVMVILPGVKQTKIFSSYKFFYEKISLEYIFSLVNCTVLRKIIFM
jgi:hypothetical protein